MINSSTKKTVPRPIPIGLAMVVSAALLSGCYSGSKLIKPPQNSELVVSGASTNANDSKMPAFVSSVIAKQSAAETNTSADFERRFIGHLQKANYFSDVVYGVYSRRPQQPYVDVSLTSNEEVDLNMGGNLAKAFLTGFTLFLLAPALPATYDYETSLTLSAKWPNGTIRDYKASCGASAYGTWPYVTATQELKKSSGECVDKCLSSVINQLTSSRVQ